MNDKEIIQYVDIVCKRSNYYVLTMLIAKDDWYKNVSLLEAISDFENEVKSRMYSRDEPLFEEKTLEFYKDIILLDGANSVAYVLNDIEERNKLFYDAVNTREDMYDGFE